MSYVTLQTLGVFEAIILGKLPLSLIAQQIGKENEKQMLLVEHTICLQTLHRDVLEHIYRMHQNSSCATCQWDHSQCGRSMHAIDDRDSLIDHRLECRIVWTEGPAVRVCFGLELRYQISICNTLVTRI